MELQIPKNSININNEIIKKENDINKYDKYLEDNYKSLFDKENIITENLKKKSKKKKKELEIDIILNQFSNNLYDIINDLIELFTNKNNFDNYLDSYVFYMKNIGIILTKKERLFYVGILFLILSFLFLFIEITS